MVCSECTPECVSAAIRKYFEEPQLREGYISGIRALNAKLSWNGFCRNLIEFAERIEK